MLPKHLAIHRHALELCQNYLHSEAKIVTQLKLVQKFNIHKQLGKKNLFLYAEEICGLSKGQAYVFSSLAKKCATHAELDEALRSSRLSISKASRIVSVIDANNAESLVEFAQNHTSKEIEREVRRISPKAAVRSSIKPLSPEWDRLEVAISRAASENIDRSKAILSQKMRTNCDLGQVIEIVFYDFVNRHDPLKKAERALTRNRMNYPHLSARAENSSDAEVRSLNYPTPNREPLTAAQKQTVDLRDQRRCTHVDKQGKTCGDDRWLHYHHIHPRHQGGSNNPENLTTLCSYHHDLVHQLVFPMEGAANLVRESSAEYRVRRALIESLLAANTQKRYFSHSSNL